MKIETLNCKYNLITILYHITVNYTNFLARYGFNSDGHDAVLERLSKLEPPGQRKGVIGVNLGKNKDSSDPVQDYVIGVRKFGHVADYLVINVSR